MADQQDPFQEGVSIAARIGLELVVATAAGAFLGYLLDSWWGSRPWVMVVGLLLGAAAGLRSVYGLVSPDRGRKS